MPDPLTQREVAAKLNISNSEAHRIEQRAMSKLKVLTMTEENTHLVAHTPDIKEIDLLFRTLPWCQFVKAPVRNGDRYTGKIVVSREEWTKSFTEEDKEYFTEGKYKVT